MKDGLRRLVRRLFGGGVRVTNKILRKWNVALAVLYLIQGLAILLLSVRYYRPLHVLFLTSDSLQTQLAHSPVTAPAMRQLAVINIAWPVATWLLVMAGFHLVQASLGRTMYEAAVSRGVNWLRWPVYTFVWLLILWCVSLLAGLADLASLLLVTIFPVAMGLLGLAMETATADAKPGQVRRWPFGTMVLLAGLAPWAAVLLTVVASTVFGGGQGNPAYVYLLIGSALLIFVLFGVNAYLAQRKQAAWRRYGFVECCYMVLAFVLTSAVAWQVFAAVLHP